MSSTILGIDYGSRHGGTTAIAWEENEVIQVRISQKKQDADAFLAEATDEFQVSLIAIDAPLSLPIGYFQEDGDLDYRVADRAVKAMSPMFLGGLTARAIRFRRIQEKLGRQLIEVYPGGLVRHWSLQHYRKKERPSIDLKQELEGHGIRFAEWPKTLHEVDAGLALWSGKRYLAGDALICGEPEEGLIII